MLGKFHGQKNLVGYIQSMGVTRGGHTEQHMGAHTHIRTHTCTHARAHTQSNNLETLEKEMTIIISTNLFSFLFLSSDVMSKLLARAELPSIRSDK